MKFVCDNCGTQYLISDEKVGPKGVKIRCKRCGNVITLRPGGTQPGEDEQVVSREQDRSGDTGREVPDFTPAEGEQDELGQAFDQLLKGGIEGTPSPEEDEDDEEERRATEIFSMEELQRLRDEQDSSDEDDRKIDQVFSQAESTDITSRKKTEGEEHEEWYVAVHDEQVGPLDLPEIEGRWEAGEIGPNTLAWHPGMDDWAPVKDVPKLRYLLGGAEQRDLPAAVEQGGRAAGGEDEEWAPASGSSLSSLVEEEMEAVQSVPPAAESEPPGEDGLLDGTGDDQEDSGMDMGEVPPWEREEVAPGEVASPSDSYFDSTFDQPTTDSGAGSGGVRSDRELAKPAYLSGESKSKSKKKFFLFGAVGLIGLIAAAVVIVHVTSGKGTPDDSDPQPIDRPAGDGDSETGKDEPGSDKEAPRNDPAGTDGKAGGKESDQPENDEQKEKPGEKGEKKKDDDKVLVVKKPGADVKKDRHDKDKRKDDERSGPARKRRRRRRKTVSFKKDRPGDKGNKQPDKTPDKSPPADSSLPERLSKAQISSVMKKYIPAMKGCVQQQLQRDPTVTGTMTVSFTIQGSGKVQKVDILSSEHKGTYVAGCITFIIKKMKFPRFSGAPITIPRVPLRLGG